MNAVRADNLPTLRSVQRFLLIWRADWVEGKMLVTFTLVGRTVPGWPQLRWTRVADAEEEGPRAPRKLHRRQESPKRSLEAADGRIQGGTFCGRLGKCNVVYADVPNHDGRELGIWVETKKGIQRRLLL